MDAVDAWMTGLVLVWGTAFVSIKVLGEVLGVFEILWLRYVPFLFLFGGWLLLRQRAVLARVTRADWGRFGLIGFLGVIGYHVPTNYGLQADGSAAELSAATGAILIATTPLWTLLFTVLAGKERFEGRRAAGSIVAFTGVAVVIFMGRGDVEFTATYRALVMLLAPILWSWYSIIGKPLIARYGGLFMTGLSMTLGTLMMLPYGLWVGAAPFEAMEPRHWAWMLYLSLAATVGGYTIWNFALSRRSASEVTAFIYLIPVIATLAGWVLLDEVVTIWFVGGAALVLGGVWQINQARMRPAQPEGIKAS